MVTGPPQDYRNGFRNLVQNAESLTFRRLRRDVLALLSQALESVEPSRVVDESIRVRKGALEILGKETFRYTGAVYLLSVGKAAEAMARGALSHLSVTSGLVVTNRPSVSFEKKRIRVQRASHPLPTEGSLQAGRSALAMADRLDSRDLLLVLLSGGASALMEATPLSRRDLQTVYRSLLRSGLDIRDVNEVRKGLSLVKGGRLAERGVARGAQVVTLVISDIVGNPLEDIGSGPSVGSSSRGGRARQILRGAGLWEEMPESARRLLASTAKTDRWEDTSGRVHAFVVADIGRACRAAAEAATGRGYRARILTTALGGEAREAGPWLVAKALSESDRPLRTATIAGGETTVAVRGRGRGGRNQELALSVVKILDGKSAVLLSCGTDGIDGNSDAAGAIVDGTTLTRSRKLGLDPQELLKRNDSNTFFEALRDLIVTGPTGTNVADLQILLLDRSVRAGGGMHSVSRGARRRGTSGTPRTPPPVRPVRRSDGRR